MELDEENFVGGGVYLFASGGWSIFWDCLC